MKGLSRIGVLLLVIAAVGQGVLAQTPAKDAGDQAAANAEPAKETEVAAGTDWARGLGIVGVCLAAALATLAGGLSISRIGGKCVDGIARQPEAAGAMFAPMLITAAMVEGSMLFSIVVCLLGILGLVGAFGG